MRVHQMSDASPLGITALRRKFRTLIQFRLPGSRKGFVRLEGGIQWPDNGPLMERDEESGALRGAGLLGAGRSNLDFGRQRSMDWTARGDLQEPCSRGFVEIPF